MNIRVHIERVVLEGVSIAAQDLPVLQAAIQAELTKLIGAHGIAPRSISNATVSHAATRPLSLNVRTAPDQFGADIGRAAYGALGRTEADVPGGHS